MCSRVLATTFIIYCLNTGFCEDLVDFACTVNSECEHFIRPGQNAICFKEKCICSDINSDQQIKCKPAILNQNNIVGGPCPCKMQNSICDPKDNICLCEPNYIVSYDRRRCIKKRISLNEQCEDNSQCISADHFSYCNPENKVCKCLEHFVEFKGQCLSAVALDKDCNDDVQCSNRTKNSICSENKCVCSPGFVANVFKSSCYLSVGYHEACNETNQCKHKLGAGSKCYDEICTCDSNHYAVNKTNSITCQRKAGYGDYCTNDLDCLHNQIESKEQSLECYLGECRCRKGFTINNGLCQISGSSRKLILNGFLFLAIILPVLQYF